MERKTKAKSLPKLRIKTINPFHSKKSNEEIAKEVNNMKSNNNENEVKLPSALKSHINKKMNKKNDLRYVTFKSPVIINNQIQQDKFLSTTDDPMSLMGYSPLALQRNNTISSPHTNIYSPSLSMVPMVPNILESDESDDSENEEKNFVIFDFDRINENDTKNDFIHSNEKCCKAMDEAKKEDIDDIIDDIINDNNSDSEDENEKKIDSESNNITKEVTDINTAMDMVIENDVEDEEDEVVIFEENDDDEEDEVELNTTSENIVNTKDENVNNNNNNQNNFVNNNNNNNLDENLFNDSSLNINDDFTKPKTKYLSYIPTLKNKNELLSLHKKSASVNSPGFMNNSTTTTINSPSSQMKNQTKPGTPIKSILKKNNEETKSPITKTHIKRSFSQNNASPNTNRHHLSTMGINMNPSETFVKSESPMENYDAFLKQEKTTNTSKVYLHRRSMGNELIKPYSRSSLVASPSPITKVAYSNNLPLNSPLYPIGQKSMKDLPSDLENSAENLVKATPQVQTMGLSYPQENGTTIMTPGLTESQMMLQPPTLPPPPPPQQPQHPLQVSQYCPYDYINYANDNAIQFPYYNSALPTIYPNYDGNMNAYYNPALAQVYYPQVNDIYAYPPPPVNYIPSEYPMSSIPIPFPCPIPIQVPIIPEQPQVAYIPSPTSYIPSSQQPNVNSPPPPQRFDSNNELNSTSSPINTNTFNRQSTKANKYSYISSKRTSSLFLSPHFLIQKRMAEMEKESGNVMNKNSLSQNTEATKETNENTQNTNSETGYVIPEFPMPNNDFLQDNESLISSPIAPIPINPLQPNKLYNEKPLKVNTKTKVVDDLLIFDQVSDNANTSNLIEFTPMLKSPVVNDKETSSATPIMSNKHELSPRTKDLISEFLDEDFNNSTTTTLDDLIKKNDESNDEGKKILLNKVNTIESRMSCDFVPPCPSDSIDTPIETPVTPSDKHLSSVFREKILKSKGLIEGINNSNLLDDTVNELNQEKIQNPNTKMFELESDSVNTDSVANSIVDSISERVSSLKIIELYDELKKTNSLEKTSPYFEKVMSHTKNNSYDGVYNNIKIPSNEIVRDINVQRHSTPVTLSPVKDDIASSSSSNSVLITSTPIKTYTKPIRNNSLKVNHNFYPTQTMNINQNNNIEVNNASNMAIYGINQENCHNENSIFNTNSVFKELFKNNGSSDSSFIMNTNNTVNPNVNNYCGYYDKDLYSNNSKGINTNALINSMSLLATAMATANSTSNLYIKTDGLREDNANNNYNNDTNLDDNISISNPLSPKSFIEAKAAAANENSYTNRVHQKVSSFFNINNNKKIMNDQHQRTLSDSDIINSKKNMNVREPRYIRVNSDSNITILNKDKNRVAYNATSLKNDVNLTKKKPTTSLSKRKNKKINLVVVNSDDNICNQNKNTNNDAASNKSKQERVSSISLLSNIIQDTSPITPYLHSPNMKFDSNEPEANNVITLEKIIDQTISVPNTSTPSTNVSTATASTTTTLSMTSTTAAINNRNVQSNRISKIYDSRNGVKQNNKMTSSPHLREVNNKIISKRLSSSSAIQVKFTEQNCNQEINNISLEEPSFELKTTTKSVYVKPQKTKKRHRFSKSLLSIKKFICKK